MKKVIFDKLAKLELDDSIEKDYIFVIAVDHSHRRPDYWIDRFYSGQ